MANVPVLRVNGTDYDVKDADAREQLLSTFLGKSGDTTTIPDSSDLNNYTTVGNYRITSATSAQTMTNCPSTYGGRLYVYSGGASTYIHQVYISDITNRMYTRFYREASGWTSWANDADSIATMNEIVGSLFVGKAGDATLIPDSSDFNSYTTPGSYKVSSLTSARTMKNCPSQFGGRLYVYTGGASAYLTQVYFQDYNTNIFLRTYRSAVGWSGWRDLNYETQFAQLYSDPVTLTYTSDNINSGAFIKYETGEIGENVYYGYSGIVPIPRGTYLIRHNFSYPTSGSAGWCLYDRNMNRISGGQGDTEIYCSPTCAFFAVSEQLSRLSSSVYIDFYGQNAIKGNAGKTIVMVGDSIIGAYRDVTSIPKQLEHRSGATCINCGFPGTAMGNDTVGTVTQDREIFCGWRILKAIADNDYTDQLAAIAGQSQFIQDHPEFEVSIANLQAVDWTKVDILTVSYGTNDFGLEVELTDNQSNLKDCNTFGGAFRTGLEAFMTAYPNIKVVIFSPIWRAAVSDGVITIDFSKDKGGRPYGLWEYVAKEESIAAEYCLPYRDMFYTTSFNAFTWTAYFPTTDGTHPRATGRAAMAKMYADFLAQY